jgi:hypothetical protein
LVNSLWFLSLAISLTGALLAVFVHQWAHSYLRATQERRSPRKRAQIRAFYARGVKRFHLPRVTRTVPILIHISLFLFFSGLAVFLFNVNLTVFKVILVWLGLCASGYTCITLMPIIYQDSPYHSPLSSFAWFCVANARILTIRLVETFPRLPRHTLTQAVRLLWLRRPEDRLAHATIRLWWPRRPEDRYSRFWPSFRRIQKAAEDFFLKVSPEIDYSTLSWMFSVLNDDNEFEQFFDALPGLCASEAASGNFRGGFIRPNENRLSNALIGMMDRTFLSDLLPEPVKQRRIIICTKAIAEVHLPKPWFILRRVLVGSWHEFLKSVQFGLLVQNWKRDDDRITAFYAQCVVAVIISNAEERDERWSRLASDPLVTPKPVLQNPLAHSDSLLLANLLSIIWLTIRTYSESPTPLHRNRTIIASSRSLSSICNFDIQNTLPELQHEFCGLWNKLVAMAQNDLDPHRILVSVTILKNIRKLYVALHKDTSAPTTSLATANDIDPILNVATSYSLCTIAGHTSSVPFMGYQTN